MSTLFPFSGGRRLLPALLTVSLATAVNSIPSLAQTRPATGFAVRADNPLLASWAGPYGGFPAFDKVQVSQFKPGLEAAMAQNLAEVQVIANNPQAPNFENTIAAM